MRLHSLIKHTKRLVAGICCATLLLYTLQPYPLLRAQEADPEPTTEVTPTPDASVIIQNDNTTTDADVDVTATTGGNADGESVTPTPSSEPTDVTEPADTSTDEFGETPTPTPTDDEQPASTDSAITIDNTASVSSSVSAAANTGGNTVNTGGGGNGSGSGTGEGSATNSPTPSPVGTTTTTTGDAYSYAQLENTINTTSVNSQVVYHTINLYINEAGTIDLSLPADLAKILVEQHPDDPTINATLTGIGVTNEANVTTNVNVSANTGSNTSTDSATATISTGDAYAILALLNRINFVMIDSVLHVAIINIFGNFTGDIWLPDIPESTGSECTDCGAVTVENDASVTTNAHAVADTGNNSINAADGTINSGNAYTAVNVVNLVNQVIYGSPYVALYINNFGVWNGQFLGYATDGLPTGSEQVMTSAACGTCIGDIGIANGSTVTTNVNVSANTGNNAIDAVENGTIATGNAYSVASVMNLVNTSLIRSFGLIGFINIFGTWTGNIGSKSLFAASGNDTGSGGGPPNENEAARVTQTEDKPERGGLLAVQNKNNVGEYVLPGDTVTLFITTKNPGSGRVYGAKLVLMLIKDGVESGTTVFELGSIDAGRSVKLTTGMVLAKNAPAGQYKVRAGVYGYTANERDEMVKVNAYADSMFALGGVRPASGQPASIDPEPASHPQPAVMGASYEPKVEPNILQALLVLLLLIPAYVGLRVSRERYQLHIALGRKTALAERLRALSIFLL